MRSRADNGFLVTEARILYRAARKSLEDFAPDGAAAIAFYAFFSIFPLLLGVIAAAGYFFESEIAC